MDQAIQEVQNCCKSGQKTLLITFVGGHGFEDGGQSMLINDSQNPCFPVEQELRDLAQSCMSRLSIAALYDTSREKLELMGGL